MKVSIVQIAKRKSYALLFDHPLLSGGNRSKLRRQRGIGNDLSYAQNQAQILEEMINNPTKYATEQWKSTLSSRSDVGCEVISAFYDGIAIEPQCLAC